MKNIINTDKAPAAVGPYNQAISIDKFVFTSGQIPMDPGSGKIVKGGIQQQTRQVLENLKAVLEASGSTLSKVVKATVYLDDINNFPQFNRVYEEYFPTEPPARSTVQVAALPMGASVEMDLIAMI